jgi:Rieske Fe-S protein
VDASWDRRAFIKGCAGAGVVGALGAAGYGVARVPSDLKVEIVRVTCPAIAVLKGSPAPYGLPLIPLRIDPTGDLHGVPDAAPSQLDWYRYCSHERAPGLREEFASTNALTYFTEARDVEGERPWYADRIGQTVNANHFPERETLTLFEQQPGVGAPFAWRSAGVDREDILTGIVVRAPAHRLRFTERVDPEVRTTIEAEWFPRDPARPDQMFLAFCSFCSHFCCVPGFHAAKAAVNKGFADKVFCTCHDSRYDPFTITMVDRHAYRYHDEPHLGRGG